MRNPHKKTEDLDFEISFYEGIIRNSPGFVQALAALGDLYTKAGRYQQGLAIDQRLILLCPDDPIVHYNLACSYSLCGNLPQALEALKRAVEFGYDDFKYMMKDEDLKSLMEDSQFKDFIQKMATQKNMQL